MVLSSGIIDEDQVVNDLIDDNPIEEDDSDDDGSDGSRKRKKSDDEDELSDRLEDDDYDLIEENLGVKVQRVRGTALLHAMPRKDFLQFVYSCNRKNLNG